MKRSRRFVFLALSSALFLLLTGIAYSTVKGSRHDLSLTSGGLTFYSTNENEICIFCHTPHNAIVDDGSGNRLPLWNRSISRNQSGFTVYTNNTLNATVGQPSGLSLLCLSCHDGITALNSLINLGKNNPIIMAGGFDQFGDIYRPTGVSYPGANIGGAIPGAAEFWGNYGVNVDANTKRIDDDHPVSFTFNAALVTADGALQLPASSDAIKLFGGRMECSTCHNVHEEGSAITQDYPFLRKSNSESAICTTCHLK